MDGPDEKRRAIEASSPVPDGSRYNPIGVVAFPTYLPANAVAERDRILN